jgi:hypothetical protein|tara:strand:+ start:1958 stop:2107 length:150 start_codon:yes stop_codon:yes gene_type:complete
MAYCIKVDGEIVLIATDEKDALAVMNSSKLDPKTKDKTIIMEVYANGKE